MLMNLKNYLAQKDRKFTFHGSKKSVDSDYTTDLKEDLTNKF